MCRSAQSDACGAQTNPGPFLPLTLTLATTLRGARGRQGQSCHTYIANEVYVHIWKIFLHVRAIIVGVEVDREPLLLKDLTFDRTLDF